MLAAVSAVRMVTLYQPGGDPNRVYYGTDTRAFVLLIGAALGALSAGAPTLSGRRARRGLIILGSGAAITLLAVMVLTGANSSWLYEGGYVLLAVLMALVLAAAAQPGRNLLARLLKTRALVGLGLISYGVYLWHWPATVWLTTHRTGLAGFPLFTLRAVVTLAAALASYALVEQPIRRGRLPTFNLRNPGVVPMSAVTVVAVMFLVPTLTFPSVQLAPAIPTSKATTLVSARYVTAPHCDAGPERPAPLVKGRHLRVQLLGNSIAVEVAPCLAQMLAARDATLTTVIHVGYPLCDFVDLLRQSLRNPPGHPDIGLLFTVPVPADPSCHASGKGSGKWPVDAHAVTKVWKQAGVYAYLVPDVPKAVRARSRTALLDVSSTLAPDFVRQDPGHVGLLDASGFLQDDHGDAQTQMPCLPGGEPGCANHAISVRDPVDHFHFCAERKWPCAPSASGGDRRAAAAIVASLIKSLRDHPPSLRLVPK